MPESLLLVEKLSVENSLTVITVNENDNLKWLVMHSSSKAQNLCPLPVINSRKRIVGIVSERDIINFSKPK